MDLTRVKRTDLSVSLERSIEMVVVDNVVSDREEALELVLGDLLV